MKHIFFTILTTVSVSACAWAQPAQRPTTEQRAEQMTSQMSDRLSLTDKQREKVRKANLKFMKPDRPRYNARRRPDAPEWNTRKPD